MNCKNPARVLTFVSILTFGLLNSPCTVADDTHSGQAIAVPAAMTTVLPPSEAERLFKFYFDGDQIFGKQDRHHRLKEVFWTPTESEVAQAEVALANTLKAKVDTRVLSEPQNIALTKYFRQYAGVMRGDKKCILVNAFPISAHSSFVVVASKNPKGGDWHDRAVLVFDGGPSFFHAAYNPVTHHIENLQFNGIA